MWPRDARARVAAAVAAETAGRARLAAARHAATTRLRANLGSPAGLAAAFAAGLLSGPAARGLRATLRSSAELRSALASLGIRPRDVVAGLRAARRLFASGAGRVPADPPRAPPAAS